MADLATLFGPLAEQSQVVYFSYDLQHRRVVYVSPAYERVMGCPADRVNEDLREWESHIHPDDFEYLLDQLKLVLGGRLVEDLELRLRHSNGQRQWLSLTLSHVRTPDGQAYLSGTVRDITRIKEYMDHAHRYNTKKNATLEILSHDLAGPLVLVQQLADHVAEHTRNYQNAALDELVQIMRVTCEDSVNLIRDFVDQEFLESANVEMKRERLDLGEWLQVLISEYKRNEAKINKRFAYHAPAKPVYVSCDKNKFEQVLNNLLSNAIKFTHDDGLIEVTLESHAHHARIIIADNGVGIPEKLHPMLFDKFTRARRPGLRGEKTTGLGMSVIRTLVHLHEGTISFESKENEGTRFMIDIPRMEPTA